ncbi:Protein kinase-like domain [Cordyceps militaris CM01]|uniref:Protein kinase-like domain n=1 Tax=Cordyceps militaris (strain CM01) TaxID=983644 RepID=G3JNR0_CORMM|nr:Protein kinase-like domain [Cordyceps militaris CM01]EGX89900.1 Protein kinase-like domain [Cordyceps militaris CM01]
MPSLWPCDVGGCQRPAVQNQGNCELCGKHLCRLHIQHQWHKCPSPELNWKEYADQYAAGEAQRLDALCRQINGEKLCARASRLRGEPPIPCQVDLSPKTLSKMMGGQNCHADVVFADGVVWIVRFRLVAPRAPPPHVRDYVLQSEADTMKYLQLHTRIPSPRVYDWALASDPANEVGIGYILMEKLPGTPLNWQGATAAQRSKIVQQLADIMLEIERHPFSQLGSLIDSQATSGGETGATSTQSAIQVRGLAKHSTSKSGINGGPLGPFRSSALAFRAQVEAYLGMIYRGEIGTAGNAVDVFLAHRFRLDNAAEDRVWGHDANPASERFYLKHADDKGDHILVSADFDIVGIIDWEWCATASKAEAFASPCMMWPVAAFYDGSNALADEERLLAGALREKGRADLADCVLRGRAVQRLLFALGPVAAAHEATKTWASLFMGMKRALDGKGEERLGQEEEEWEQWKAQALREWKDEPLLQAVLAGGQVGVADPK